MTLDSLLNRETPPPPDEFNLDYEELVRFFWKYKGLELEAKRNTEFWEATNENLKDAYHRLDNQERELERVYGLVQEDLSVAHGIQDALLPSLQTEKGVPFEIAIYNKQLKEVGGDYFDFFRTKSNHFAVGVFDISGHGVSAALIMAYLKSQFTLVMEKCDSPGEIVEQVNLLSMAFFRKIKRYAVVNLVVIRPRHITYVCAGGYGILVHDGILCSFAKNSNFLGLREKPFDDFTLPVVRGDLLVLHTDGIIETQNNDGDDYSAGRLHRLIREHWRDDVNEILNCCIQDYNKFKTGDQDDVTLIIIRF
ncbi:MAG: SpoIIE family protein phosphatase [Spirochaetales bacterium]|nr:SpoIIE family protein phosphatase [Spirochaetales bacterium]